MVAKKKSSRKYSESTQKEVKDEMHRYKRGKAYSGKGGKTKVKSRKQAIAIALSKARKNGKKVPKKATSKSNPTSSKRAKSKSSSRKRLN